MKDVTIHADDINMEHRAAQSSATDAVQHAIQCGKLLTEAKAKLNHGEFMPWVRDNCEFSQDRANVYMRAAEKAKFIAHNEFASIAALLAHGKPKPEPKPEPPRIESKPLPPKKPEKPKPQGYIAICQELGLLSNQAGKSARDKIKAELSKLTGFNVGKVETHEQAAAIREAALTLLAKRKPAKLPKVDDVRVEVPETHKERFDKALKKATDAEIARLRAIFNDQLDAKVKELVGRRTTALDEQEKQLAEARKAINARDESVVPLITETEAKIITGCLHPDRPTRSKEQLEKAFAIWQRIVEYRTVRYSREVLKRCGWSK